MTCLTDAKACWKSLVLMVATASASLVLFKSFGVTGAGLAISAGAFGPVVYVWFGVASIRFAKWRRRKKRC